MNCAIIGSKLDKRIDDRMAAILLAEQSVSPEWRIEKTLTDLGYRVTSVADAKLVYMVKNHIYDLIIWAVEGFDENAGKLLEQIRLFSDVPILGIRAKEADGWIGEGPGKALSGMLGLSMDKEALGDCVSYYLREAYKKFHDMRLYQYKGLKISSGSIKKVEMNQKGLDLTVKEYMILSLLMRHRNRIYTKASLYEAVWRQPYTGDDNAVKIHISNLRRKLKEADPETRYIETVWGLGYRLSKN